MVKEDILTLIMKAEKDYNKSVDKAMADAKLYVDGKRKIQNDHVEELKREWYLYAKSENEKFLDMLLEKEREIDNESDTRKAELRAMQLEKAEAISERIKEEVLSLYGNCKNGKTGVDI
jgi:hypothetical protein